MGKAQSKRSVDITTDPAKDGGITEGTGKLEKIEDVDQLKSQANGDAQHNEGDSVSQSIWELTTCQFPIATGMLFPLSAWEFHCPEDVSNQRSAV